MLHERADGALKVRTQAIQVVGRGVVPTGVRDLRKRRPVDPGPLRDFFQGDSAALPELPVRNHFFESESDHNRAGSMG